MDIICRKMQRMADPRYLNTMLLDEILNNVYMSRSAVVDGLLCSGVYIFAEAPKIGKSFLVAQIAFYVSTRQKLWDYEVHQGTVLYLALEDDQHRLQQRMSRMFGVDGTQNLHFATVAGQIISSFGATPVNQCCTKGVFVCAR